MLRNVLRSWIVVLACAAALALAACGSSHQHASRRLGDSRLSSSTVGSGAGVSFKHVPGPPFGVAVTPDGRYAFVDLMDGQVQVYRLGSGVPVLMRTISVPGDATGCSITRDGRLLLVAGSRGVVVISVSRAVHKTPHPVLGTLSPSAKTHLAMLASGIESASSANGRYVFESLEYPGEVAVYRIGSTQHPQLGKHSYRGLITLGEAVVGSALSPNGRYLYVTSESGSPTGEGNQAQGSLSVINVARAEHDPSHAVVGSVLAMSQPVRVAVSPDGSTVWITARGSNRLLAFSAAKLLSSPRHALLASVAVGTAPVGVAVLDNGQRLLVADSDRFDARGGHASLTVVDAQAALAGRPAIVATLKSGGFPREISVSAKQNQALVTNFGSNLLEVVDLRSYEVKGPLSETP